MKKLLAILLSVLMLLATGCTDTDSPDASTGDVAQTGDGTTADTGTDTSSDTPAQTDGKDVPTDPPALPYTVKITRPDVLIYVSPGYDNRDIGKLVDIGTYTITEEFTDDEGFLWGKLKSGIGWIDLDKALAEASHIPITMERITEKAAREIDCPMHVVEEADYTQWLLMQPYEKLTNVRLCFMDFTENGFENGEELYTIDALTVTTPLILGVVFYGDFTMFSLTFTDAAGEEHQYRIYESGRNGCAVFDKYEG